MKSLATSNPAEGMRDDGTLPRGGSSSGEAAREGSNVKRSASSRALGSPRLAASRARPGSPGSQPRSAMRAFRGLWRTGPVVAMANLLFGLTRLDALQRHQSLHVKLTWQAL